MLFRYAILAFALTAPHRLFSMLYDATPYGEVLRAWTDGLGLAPGAAVLEIGCGPGRLAHDLAAAGFCVTGADRSARMIRAARRNTASGATFVETGGGALPFEGGRFDAAIAASLINVVPDPSALLAEMTRVTRPGGIVSCFFPGPDFTPALVARFAARGNADRTSTALMDVWAAASRKIAPHSVVEWMEGAGIEAPAVTSFLDGALHAVTGRVPFA